MDALEQLRRWAVRASEEAAPSPDVSLPVMRTLAQLRRDGAGEVRRFGWTPHAALAAATALCVMFGLQAWRVIDDPWIAWLDVFTEWWLI